MENFKCRSNLPILTNAIRRKYSHIHGQSGDPAEVLFTTGHDEVVVKASLQKSRKCMGDGRMAPIIFHLGTTKTVVCLTPWSEKGPKFSGRHSQSGSWDTMPQAPSHTAPRYDPQAQEPPRGVINTSKHFNGRFCCRSLKITIPGSSCLQNMKHNIVYLINTV